MSIDSNIYTGYVYLWYDTKSKFFYLGGHKGQVQDSYICSSKTMLRTYHKRPETFKIKILEYVAGDTNNLRETEQKWLNMIKDKELMLSGNVKNGTCRYYNAKKHSSGGNGKGTNKGKSHVAWNKGRRNCYTPETIRKMSEAHGGRIFSEEHRRKIGEAGKGRICSEETRRKISEAKIGKSIIRNGMMGRTHSEETKRKISVAGLGRVHSEETKRKMSEAKIEKYRTTPSPLKGTTLPEETKRKIGESNRNKIPWNKGLTDKRKMIK